MMPTDPDNVQSATALTMTKVCSTLGCGHLLSRHALGDCLVRPCAAGPHYANEARSDPHSDCRDRERRLREYVTHKGDCPLNGYSIEGSCTCGLSSLMEGA